MKSIRLTKSRRGYIEVNAKKQIEANNPISQNTKTDIYKKQVIKDIQERMAHIHEAAKLHGLTDAITYTRHGIYLNMGLILMPSDLEDKLPASEEFIAPYLLDGDFSKKFNTSYELIYRPMVEQTELENQAIRNQNAAKLTELREILEKCNTTKQLELIWEDAPSYYSYEMKQELGL